MAHLHVRCPSCAKLYQVDVSSIFSTQPHFQCQACPAQFAFEFPPADPANVVARVGPEDGDRIVLGAHYDTCGPLPGADDNASGVAGLIELTRLLAAASPKTRVDLVAFTLEEPPYFRTRNMGSAVHARSLAGARLRGMIAIEMIGYFTDAPNSQAYPSPLLRLAYPSVGNFIAVVGRFGDGGLTRTISRAMRRASPWKFPARCSRSRRRWSIICCGSPRKR